MGGYDCYFVGVVEGEVGVYEDEDVGDGLGEGEGGGEEGPGMGVCIEDDGEEGRGGFCGGWSAEVWVSERKRGGGHGGEDHEGRLTIGRFLVMFGSVYGVHG